MSEGSNKEYKSDVFSMLMEIPENALSVYNALNESDYRDPSEIEIFRLENGIRLSIRNDSSFIIDAYLSLYEHQSRRNPNMPLRLLIYVTGLYKHLVKNKDLFSTALRKIPTPKFAVFYNGVEEGPEEEEMRLSDAFQHPTDEPELELKCTVYNINPDYNRDLLGKCSVLKEYTAFVEQVREYEKLYPLEEALDHAINSCISEHILEDFLRKNRAEVKRVSMLDYTFERRIKLAEEENREIIGQLTAQNDQLSAQNDQLSIENNQLSTVNNQLSTVNDQLTEKNDQLTAQNEQLLSRIERMEKILAEHGLTQN